MKSKRINRLILASLTVGLVTTFVVTASALDFSVQFGTPPPPPPPPMQRVAPPPQVYAEFYSNSVINLGCAYFSLDYATVYAYSRDYNLTPDQVVYILYLSQYSHRSPPFVIHVYKKYHNRGWSVMAKHLGLSSGYPQWLIDADASSVAVLYCTSAYYDVPYVQIQGMYTQGYRPDEIVIAVNVSSQSGQPVSGILGARNNGTSWENIATQNKTTMDAMKAPHAQGQSVKFTAPLEEKASTQAVGKNTKTTTTNQATQGNKQNNTVKPTQGSASNGQNKGTTQGVAKNTKTTTTNQVTQGNNQGSTVKSTQGSGSNGQNQTSAQGVAKKTKTTTTNQVSGSTGQNQKSTQAAAKTTKPTTTNPATQENKQGKVIPAQGSGSNEQKQDQTKGKNDKNTGTDDEKQKGDEKPGN